MALLTQEQAVQAAADYIPLMKKIAYPMVGRHLNHAEDIHSDLYLLLVEFLQTFDDESSLKLPNYIRNYFKFRVIDYEKKMFRFRPVSLEVIRDEDGRTIDILDTCRDHTLVVCDIDVVQEHLRKRLPASNARIMRKIFINGMDWRKVAKEEGKSKQKLLQVYVHSLKLLRGRVTRKYPGNWRPTILGTEKKSIAAIAKDPRCLVSRDVVRKRIVKEGMSAITAITTPPQISMPPRFKILAFGEAKSMKAWSRDPRCQVSFAGLQKRLHQGWDAEKAISTAAHKLMSAFGEEKTLPEWVKDPRCNVTYQCLDRRMRHKGMSLQEALTTPKSEGHRWSKGESGNISGKNTKKKEAS